MSDATLTGPHVPPAGGGAPKRLVVMLHGYGADGSDLIGLAPFLASKLPDAAFHSPNGPQPCEMAPFGRQWFSLATYDPEMLRRRAETLPPALHAMEQGARETAPVLDAWLDAMLDHYGLGGEALMLMGFSQGTMMALHVGLRRKVAPAAIIGYSGALLGPAALPQEITARPPVLLVHGSADEVVPPEAMPLAAEALRGAGVPVETLEVPGLPHGIDETCAEAGRSFLARHARTVPGPL